MVIAAWLIARALGLGVTLADCVVLIPVIVLVSILPISVGGWGVRESVMVGLFALIGISSSDALALSVLLGLGGIVVAIPGAFLWFIRDDHSKARADLEDPPIGGRPD